MDTNKMREQFEAWAAKNYVVPPGVGHLLVRAEIGDGYRLSSINHAWHGWKASREEIVFSIGPVPVDEVTCPISVEEFWIQAIEAQGLKVAP